MKKLESLRNKKNVLAYLEDIKTNLNSISKENFEIGVVEIHLTENCDLSCSYCTYKKSNIKQRSTIKLSSLNKILSLNPKAIVLSGGGEPTLYKDQKNSFIDIINHIKRKNPNIKIGLITNGNVIDINSDINKLDWVRVSLDTLNKEEFYEIKKGKLNDRLLSIENYLKTDIKNIGIGYLINQYNLLKVIPDTKQIVSMFKKKSLNIDKLNIQFRKICGIDSCNCQSPIYINNVITNDLSIEWSNNLTKIALELDVLKKSDSELYKFFIENTNILELITSKKEESNKKLTKYCYTSLLRWIVKANSDIHSCVLGASNSEKIIGNLESQCLNQIIKNSKEAYYKNPKYCYKEFCCGLNSNKLNLEIENNLNNKKIEKIEKSFF